MKINIGIVDDHQLFLKSLSLLISGFRDFTIVVEALNGKDLLDKMQLKKIEPDILLVDVNMPIMNGIATAEYFAAHHPLIKIVALSMKDDDATIIAMLKAGACAYLLKDIHPMHWKTPCWKYTQAAFTMPMPPTLTTGGCYSII